MIFVSVCIIVYKSIENFVSYFPNYTSALLGASLSVYTHLTLYLRYINALESLQYLDRLAGYV